MLPTTYRKFRLPKILDERGNLSVFENNGYFPFEIQWVSWFFSEADSAYDTRLASQDQVVIVLSGSLKINVRQTGLPENIARFPECSNVCRPSDDLLRHGPHRSEPSQSSVLDNEPPARYVIKDGLLEEEILLNDVCNCIHLPASTASRISWSAADTSAFITGSALTDAGQLYINFLPNRKTAHEHYELLG